MAALEVEAGREKREPPSSSAVVLDARALGLTDEQFFLLCQANRDLRLEMTSEGEIVIMPPTGTDTGRRNAKLTQRLCNWAEVDGTGECFDSSTVFTLPNGAKRSPDASWVRRERYEALTTEEREVFAPLCPDFVAELRSKTDRLAALKEKLAEYVANGAQLGWLIDPPERKVYVYRPGAEVEALDAPETVAGDPVLPGFTLELREIW